MKNILFVYLLIISFFSFAQTIPDFEKITDVNILKRSFFNYLLPIIKVENKKLLTLRNKLKRWRNQKTLFEAQQKELERLARIYKSKSDINALLMHIDIIPSSLALAQAANESNWGRSRFAKNYHNFFGIWCFKKGCGVVPNSRNKSDTHEIATYDNPSKSVAHYMLTLNRHASYQNFRMIRTNLRKLNISTLDGFMLTVGIRNYASIGTEYIKSLKQIIKYNALSKYD